MKLSNNFSLAEMTRSSTATKKGIDNTPNSSQIENLLILCDNVLQPLRDALGPIVISSGFRSVKLNTAIGGSSSSQHCALKGAASDIDLGLLNAKVFNYIKSNLIWDQLIWEFGSEDCPSWVHVSFNEGHNRKQILKAIKKDGKTKYINF
tara:strand:- start:5812 stop:6261 length:450 start_codon:yes stop_codon:yes gene_type:complete